MDQNGGNSKKCFVVIPFGADEDEVKHFRGWYDLVIMPAIKEAGYEPILAAAEEKPNAINDDIRSHLVCDEMVLVDLGGCGPEDLPNPNVMYELGIRHAMNLPVIMMAWKGQALPFDISNQRIIICERNFSSVEPARKRIVKFIKSAETGDYYRPMDAVERYAVLEKASSEISEESVLHAVLQELRHLRRSSVIARRAPSSQTTVKTAMKGRGREFKKVLFNYFESIGGDTASWGKILRQSIESIRQFKPWTIDNWKAYLDARVAGYPHLVAAYSGEHQSSQLIKPNLRVYVLAKSLGVKSSTIVAWCQQHDITSVANHMSIVPQNSIPAILGVFS